MTVLLALDPGTRKAGVALFLDGILLAAGRVESPFAQGNRAAECAAVAEAAWAWARSRLGWPPATPAPAVCRWALEVAPAWFSAWLALPAGSPPRLVDEVALEWPQLYQMDRQDGDQNDLPPLAGVDAALATLLNLRLEKVHSYLPREWKGGSVPKKVMCPRVLERLTFDERLRVAVRPRGGLDYDAVDAVGVGLHHLGRLVRRRVID